MFNKRVENLTFDDVVRFLEERQPESIHLDYKREMVRADKIAKLASAMANTDGGFVIFGANEEDEVPVPPYEGGNLGNDPKQTVQNACREYVTPHVELHCSQVLRNPNWKSKAFLVMAVPQSGKAPHVFKKPSDEEGYVYIKVEDHKQPVFPTLSRYELIRQEREACRGKAEELAGFAQSQLMTTWHQAVSAAEGGTAGLSCQQMTLLTIAVTRAYPGPEDVSSPQGSIERLCKYATVVKQPVFQFGRFSDSWQPLEMAIPAKTDDWLDAYATGARTNTKQRKWTLPRSVVLENAGCFAGRVGIPLCKATPYRERRSPEARSYIPAALLCGFGLGVIRAAFRWFQAFGCYAALNIRVELDSPTAEHFILKPDADQPAPEHSHGWHKQQREGVGYVVSEGSFIGPGAPRVGREYHSPWPSEPEAERISEDIARMYVSGYNVKDAETVSDFINAMRAKVS